MDRIAEILAILADAAQVTALTDAEVGELETELRGIFDAIRAGEHEGVESTDIATLTSVRDAIQGLQALAGTRLEAAAELQRQIDELEASLAETEAEGGDTADGGDEGEGGDGGDGAGDEGSGDEGGEGAAEGADAELVTAGAAPAGRPSLGAVSRVQPRATRANARPAPPLNPRVTIVGPSGVHETLTAAAADMREAFKGIGVNRGKVPLVHISPDYPEERQLSDIDYRANQRKIDAVVAAGARPEDSIVAAGGWDAPAEVRYDLVVQAQAQRPVKNSLQTFQADRGSVTLPTSPTMADIDFTFDVSTATGNEAVSIWTTEDDLAALDDDLTKPIQRVTQPDYATFTAYAVVRRLRNGNMAAKANPENVAAWNQLLLAVHARVGEMKMLEAMKKDAGTKELVDPDTVFGAARDIVEQLLRLTTFMRSAERADPNARVHAWLPAWLIQLMQADLVRTTRADAGEALIIASTVINSQLSSAGVNPTWYIDSPITGPTQILRKQTDGSTSAQWPCAVQYGVAFENHYAAMDMNGIDLGVIRDTSLNEVNDFETFAESFEGVIAHRGPEALWVTQSLIPDGTSAAPIDGDIPACES